MFNCTVEATIYIKSAHFSPLPQFGICCVLSISTFHLMLFNIHVEAQNYTFVEIQDGCHLEFVFLAVIEDIFVIFGTVIDIGHWMVTTAKYPTVDKTQDGGRRQVRLVFVIVTLVMTAQTMSFHID